MIELENVIKVFPDGTEAVKDLSLKVPRGEICVLIGPSGCGKTTSMKMINRLIPITSGKIYVNGQDIQTFNPQDLRRNIGYAIQQVGLFPHMTVRENIEVVPKLLGWSKQERLKRARELLDMVGMDPDTYLDRHPSELSGGQQQRIGVARCLGADPPNLLMDEPFGAIDPITREKLQDEFLRIQDEIQKTIIFVTHDIDEALKMGDRIALMSEGELIQYSTPPELLANPANDFVRDFVGADRALKELRLLRVEEVMNPTPPTVDANDSFQVAREKFEREDQQTGRLRRYMLVVEGDHFRGWVDRHDLDGQPEDGHVRDVIIKSAATAGPDMSMNQAMATVLSNAIGNLAITDEQNRLLGLLTFNSIRRVMAQSYTGEEAAEPTDDDTLETEEL